MTKRRIKSEIKAGLAQLATTPQDGRAHLKEVVAAARDKSNPLHSYFDKPALERLRIQAGKGGRTVVIQLLHPPSKPTTYPVSVKFVPAPSSCSAATPTTGRRQRKRAAP